MITFNNFIHCSKNIQDINTTNKTNLYPFDNSFSTAKCSPKKMLKVSFDCRVRRLQINKKVTTFNTKIGQYTDTKEYKYATRGIFGRNLQGI